MSSLALTRLTAARVPNLAAWRERLPGIGVSALLALVAGGLADSLGDPLARNPLLVAMLLGLMIGNLFGCPEKLKPGLDFTKRYLLRLAVVLVGFRITVRLLVDLGFMPVLLAVTELVLMFLLVQWLARKVFKLDHTLSTLIAAGTSICGAAAILSVASLLRARTQQTAIAVTVITLVGTAALFIYPVAFLEGHLAGLDDDRYGMFVGASIYELAQVYGAAFAVSELALNTATLVKLIKVLMLVPLLLTLGWLQRRSARETGDSPIPFPWFIVAFVAVMLFNSSITLPGVLRTAVLRIDLFLFLMVMIALGLGTHLSLLRKEGGAWRLLGIGAVSLALAAGITYTLVRYAFPSIAQDAPSMAAGAATDAAELHTAGGRVFTATGCAKCHVPSLPAGERRLLLYSDLLLHDMGPALDDKIVQGEASGRDWRTTPLTGLGLRTRYLHDGRAETLRDAIAAHGGEGEIVRDRFYRLDETDKQALYVFLGGL